MKDALIMMTRLPLPGYTKTRMLTTLDAAGCAQLHRNCLLDLHEVLTELNRRRSVQVYIYHTPDGPLETLKGLVPAGALLHNQVDGTLGERMSQAFSQVSAAGFDRMLLIGSDAPQISPDILLEAYRLLKAGDLVLGPTEDGGYYLMGLNKPCPDLLVKDMPWGESSVLERTVAIGASLGLVVHYLPLIRDLDEPADCLAFLKRSGADNQNQGKPVHTMDFLQKQFDKQ